MKKLNILQLSVLDSPGNRFNGYDLSRKFNERGHSSQLVVWKKNTNSPFVINLSPDILVKLSNRFINRIEMKLGFQSLLHISWISLLFKKEFWKSDVIHLHLIHTGFFSLLALPIISRLKPTFWTLHDPWAFTGHCIHPIDCNKWLSECNQCPSPSAPFPVAYGNVSLLFEIKKKIYRHSKIRLIVFSDWMRDKVEKSPLMGHLPLNVIRPGIDTKLFSPSLDKKLSKAKLGIPEDAIVISFRQTEWVFKGLEFIKEAFRLLVDDSDKIVILTCQEKGGLGDLYQYFKCVEVELIDSEEEMVSFFRASDLFLMPSIAESFGMMALEASSCGVPTITFEGTPVSEACFAADGGGIAVPYKKTKALADAMKKLIHDNDYRQKRGKKARELAIERNCFDRHVEDHEMIYNA